MNFKTEEKTVEVAASSHKETIYICPDCAATFEDEDDAKDHFGQKHAVKRTARVGNYSLVLFENEELANLHVGDAFDRHLHWEGPGWYFVSEKEEPCSRGCCWDTHYRWEPIAALETKLRERLRLAEQDLEHLHIFKNNNA